MAAITNISQLPQGVHEFGWQQPNSHGKAADSSQQLTPAPGSSRMVSVSSDRPMAQDAASPIVSATVAPRTVKLGNRPSASEQMLGRAGGLLEQARTEAERGNLEDALEHAYQAALRAAGAWVDSAKLRKRRGPANAWDQLERAGAAGRMWAVKFRAFSKLRGRVASGLPVDLSAANVAELVALAGEFLTAVDGVLFGAEAPKSA